MVFSVDATTTDSIGKYINDSTVPNAKMAIHIRNNRPRLILFAITAIPAKREIRYDYGAKGLWWRTNFPRYKRPMHLDVSIIVYRKEKGGDLGSKLRSY